VYIPPYTGTSEGEVTGSACGCSGTGDAVAAGLVPVGADVEVDGVVGCVVVPGSTAAGEQAAITREIAINTLNAIQRTFLFIYYDPPRQLMLAVRQHN
jgi:hypothetical protein